MNLIHIICLIYIYFSAKSMYHKLEGKENKVLYFFREVIDCSVCLGFWATLILTFDPVKAVAVSMFFGVLSFFFSINQKQI